MPVTRLSIYNDALLFLGERSLSSLTEEREPRRLLDQVWLNDGVDHCLEEGQWYFAMRTIQIDYDPAVTPGFGYQYAFSKPTDWVNTSGLCTDEYFREPLTRYTDEAGYWYADESPLYVRYVSNHAQYGGNYAAWPRSFAEFVAAHFAYKIAFKVGGDGLRSGMLALRDEMLTRAKNRAAMALPTSFPAQGSWNRSRSRFGGNGRDRGSNGSLIG